MAFLNGDDAHNTVAQKGIRLPKVREKLSNLVRRKGSTRSKLQLTGTTTPRASTDGVLTTTKTGVPIIDVDVTQTRSYRLAEGWLEQEESKKSPSSPNRRRHCQGGGDSQRESRAEEEDLRRSNKTPIAAMFSKSTDQLACALESISFRKPVHLASASTTVLPAGGATGSVSIATSAVKATKQEVSAPKAPPAPAPEPTPIRISLQHSLVEEPVAITTPVPQSRGRTVGPSWGIRTVPADPSDAQGHSIRHVGLLRSVGDNTTGLRVSGGGNGNGIGNSNGGGSAVGDSAKRFSAPSVSSPVPVPEPTMKTVLSTVPRSSSLNMPPATPSSLNPDNQRRSWQPAPTSVPSTRTSQDGTGTGTGMPPPPRRTLTSRPPSVALTSSRLSWIRDLENKSSSTSSSASSSTSDMQRLKKTGGGVAGKLAMFEQIQKQTQPALPPTISRSNSRASSRSRMSSAAFTDHSGSVFSAAGSHQLADDGRGRPLSFVSTGTGRTSIDSTRESLSVSHRNSGVMAYYDDGFRERMEGVAGGWAKQLQKLTGGGKDKDKEDGGEKEKDEEVKRDSPMLDADVGADVTVAKSEEAEGEAEWKAPVALPFLADVRAAGDKDRSVKDEEKPSEEEEKPLSNEDVVSDEEQPANVEEEPTKEEEQPTKEEEPATNEQLVKDEAVEGDEDEAANESMEEEDLAKEQEPVAEPVEEPVIKEEGLTKDEEIVKDSDEEPVEKQEESAKVEQPLVKDDEEVSKPEEELVKISTAVEEPQE